MQIPFVAVSSWVYVQAGNSSIHWLVTPANFSVAVPGASSGGGESFDPEVYGDETNEHVDNVCAFTATGKVLLAWTDNENDPQYALSKACADYLEQQTDAKGRKLEDGQYRNGELRHRHDLRFTGNDVW